MAESINTPIGLAQYKLNHPIMSSAKKLLIVGPAWVGDIVMAQSLFIFLKQKYPDLLIDVLAPTWSQPMLDAMPEINRSIQMPLGHGKLGLLERYQLGKSLRDEQYDWSITLPNSWKSALVPFFANIPKRTGFKGEVRYGLLNDIRPLNKQKLTMTVQRFVALAAGDEISLDDCPKPALIVNHDEAQAITNKFQLSPSLPVLALCPGAEYGPAKCWPINYYAELAQYYIQLDWQVILLGSEKDSSSTQAIKHQLSHPNCHDLAGKTTLHEAIVLLSLAKQVVSNDSGLMHIAAAVDSPVVAIYGSSDPSFTPPLSNNAKIAYLSLPCSPCFKRQCPLGHLDCLTKLNPEYIIQLIEST